MSSNDEKHIQESDAAAIIKACSAINSTYLVDLGKDQTGFERKVLVAKQGFEVKDIKPLLDKYLVRPERRKGTARFTTLAAFIAHANRFKDGDSVVFADDDQKAPSLTAVLDYHRKGSDGLPQFGEHRGTYHFPLSDEWKAWKAKNGVVMSQSDFARFVEDRLLDVADPASAKEGSMAHDWAHRSRQTFATPSRLLELSRGLQVHVKHAVRNEGKLESGEGVIHYATTNEDANGKALEIPTALLLAIPVFKLGPLYSVPVRLRYRVDGPAVLWSYELARTDQVFEDAFEVTCTEAHTSTELVVLRGAPEQ